ncbi:MAG TPA: response regulator [Vicinamibacterales bacterium]|nr:response regulator [Vicinamibacterales bacterium]
MSSGPDSQTLPNVPIIHRPGDVSGAALRRAPLDVCKRLLVVDDEVPILKLVTRILATDNYEILSANSGEEAAQMVSSPDFAGIDLLVTDLLMPGMNGRELAAIVRGKYPKTRVLYVTGFADNLFQDLSELGEGESFIEKPFGTDGLLEATRLLMFGHIAEGEEPHDKRDDVSEWADERFRAKFVRLLRRLRIA